MSEQHLHHSDRAPNLWIGDDVQLGEASIGVNVVIHAGSVIHDGVTLQDGAVVGKPPKLGRRSSASRESNEPLIIDEGATVCTQAVVFQGARVGRDAIIGDQAHVRERARVGEATVIGRGSAIGVETTVGERVSVQTACWLTSWSTIEDDAFLGPGVMTMNDDTMGRHPSGQRLRGPTLGRACRVGGGVLLTPGVEIGEEAFVGAGAVVTHDVPARARMLGIPARAIGTVGDDALLESWR